MKFLKRYKMPILYLVFGVLTTIINIASYHIFYNVLHFSNTLSNVISWLLSVTFAYITNKIWVFESTDKGIKAIFREVISFFSCRLATGVLDILIMYISVDILSYPALPFKVISNVVVIILNYVMSKLIIFKKQK